MAEAKIARARHGIGIVRRLQLVGFVTLAGAWELLSQSGLVYRGVIPSWGLIVGAMVRLVVTRDFWFNFGVTLVEIILALTIGGVAGIVVGVALGASRFAASAFEPLINCVASTPKVVFLPLLYLFFGIGMGSKIAAGALSCFFPLVIGIVAAMLEINPVLVRVAQSFRLTWWQTARTVYVPAISEAIANGLRIAAGVSVGVCLIAESRFSYAGLGHMVIDSFNRSRFPQVYAVLIITLALAVAANALIARLGRRPRTH